MTAIYNQAKGSACVLRFHIATEGGWDASGASACLLAAALLWAGAPLSWAILLALFGTAASFGLLRRYHGAISLKGVGVDEPAGEAPSAAA